jgi:5'-nucleotidase (lipoprotein e(P4) family)
MQPEQENQTTTNEKLLIATLYHQKSAERDALCYQAYNAAQMQLDKILEENKNPEKLAIVLDLDETVLDNSPYEAKCILDHISYPTGWDEWMHAANAKAIPGSIAFLDYAKSKGVEIFYITNRKEKYRQATLQNLNMLGIAPKTEANLLLRGDDSSKESRREKVLADHEIVMLFGDNLADFTKLFDGQHSTAKRAEITDSLQQEFGKRFIVFPNAMYGEWLNALTDYNFKLSPQEQTELLKSRLEGF